MTLITIPIALFLAAHQPAVPAPLAPPAEQARINRLIQDLADDSVRFNADTAVWRLQEIGAPAIPALEVALDSTDWQQRQAAAFILRRLDGYAPSRRMFRVSIEGLHDDALPLENRPGRDRAYTNIYNAASGTRYLAEHAEAAEALLIAGMESDDLQQRFLCAVALGWGGRTKSLPRASEILLPHLRDNRIPCDGLLAACALHHFGPCARPILLGARWHAVDAQQRELLDLILLDLQDPPSTDADFLKRSGMQHAMKGMYDPVATLGIDSIGMDWSSPMTEHDRDTPPEPEKP